MNDHNGSIWFLFLDSVMTFCPNISLFFRPWSRWTGARPCVGHRPKRRQPAPERPHGHCAPVSTKLPASHAGRKHHKSGPPWRLMRRRRRTWFSKWQSLHILECVLAFFWHLFTRIVQKKNRDHQIQNCDHFSRIFLLSALLLENPNKLLRRGGHGYLHAVLGRSKTSGVVTAAVSLYEYLFI